MRTRSCVRDTVKVRTRYPSSRWPRNLDPRICARIRSVGGNATRLDRAREFGGQCGFFVLRGRLGRLRRFRQWRKIEHGSDIMGASSWLEQEGIRRQTAHEYTKHDWDISPVCVAALKGAPRPKTYTTCWDITATVWLR